jgi:lysophospholipase L1-like esterase
MIKSIISLLVIFSITSCLNHEEEKGEMENNQALNKTINYLALGDSYTIGEGVEQSERWPNQLGKELEQLNYTINSIDIIARTGWTTNNLLRAIDNSEIKEYNLVSLLIGVNNQYQGLPFSSFEMELELLLNKSIELAGDVNRIFVVSIPDYGVTPFGKSNSERIKDEIDKYNEYISDQCKSRNIPFINITDISRDLGDSEGALAPDNLHPSGSQYKKWVDKILPVVTGLLNK